MPSLEVPDWLQPPTQVQRQQLAYQEELVKQKAASMLRKSVGLSRMKSQAAELQSSGVDPLTARKTALLDNADLIFVDEPEALVRLQKNDDVNSIRQRAQEQLDFHRYQTNKLLQDREDRLARQHAETLQLKQDILDQKALSDREKLEYQERIKTAEQQLKAQRDMTDLLKTRSEIQHREMLEKISMQNLDLNREKAKESRAARIEKDPQITSLQTRLNVAERSLETKKTSGPGMLQRKSTYQGELEALQKNVDTLKAQIEARRSELGGEAPKQETEPQDKNDPLGIRTLLK